MSQDRWIRLTLAAVTVASLGLSGCIATERPRATSLLEGSGPTAAITARQEADAQIALGRSAELRGDLDQARNAYEDALRRDKHRADAHQRLAVLDDKRGNYRESAERYRRAIEADPGNPDIYCDMGYSLYLQHRWADAERNLRQAIALDPEHRRAHNNLGLVLAHCARPDDALAEFLKGGCDDAQARENVAFALTTEGRMGEARGQYRLALRVRPDSQTTPARLRELDAFATKVAAAGGTNPARDPAVLTTATASARPVTPTAAAPMPAAVRAQALGAMIPTEPRPQGRSSLPSPK